MADSSSNQIAFNGQVNVMQVMDMFTQADSNHSGKMDFNEFFVMWKMLGLTPLDKELAVQTFETFDADNSGFVEIEEFQTFLESIGSWKDGHVEDKEFHWGYEEHNGPETWKDHFEAACGSEQSPIDIDTKAEAADPSAPSVTVHYEKCSAICVNNGHTVQWTVENAGHIKIGDKQYDLCQFHFHIPSEHALDGQIHPICFHFVHRADDGELAVLGFLFKNAETSHPFIDNITNNAPVAKMDSADIGEVNFDLLDFLDCNYVNYMGSLTTPPCSQGVIWYVNTTLHDISHAQIAWFRSCIPFNNARPLMPLNGRAMCIKCIASN